MSLLKCSTAGTAEQRCLLGYVLFPLLGGMLWTTTAFGEMDGKAAAQTQGKVTQVSPSPNYNLTTDEGDLTQLTDGRLSRPVKWLHKDTVGWQDAGQIVIDVKFDHARAVNEICLSTARADYAAVEYPRTLQAFVSENGVQYSRFGQMLATADSRSILPYSESKLCLAGSFYGKHVTLVVRPAGKYFFTDEIQFHGAEQLVEPRRAHSKQAGLGRKFLPIVAASEEVRFALRQAVASVVSGVGESQLAIIHNQIDSALWAVRSQRELDALLEVPQLERLIYPKTPSSEEGLESAIAQSYADENLRVRHVDPFGDAPLYAGHRAPSPEWSWGAPIAVGGETTYASVVVENAGNRAFRVRSALEELPDGWDGELFEVVPVLSADGRLLGDGVVPLKESFQFHAVQAKQIILGLKNRRAFNGIARFRLVLSESHTGDKLLDIPLSVESIPSRGENPTPLEVTNWFYTNSPLLAKNRNDVLRELDRGATSLLMLSPWELFSAPRDGEIKAGEVRSLGMFSAVERARFHFALFVGANDGVLLERFGAGGCRNRNTIELIGRALSDVRDQLNQRGIPDKQIYIYPVDEPDSESEFDCVEAIAADSKRRFPSVKTFITLGELEGQRLARVMPLIDAFFVLDGEAGKDERTAAIVRAKRDLWLYSAEGGGKVSSADEFYLGAAWRAFFQNAEGIGIWTLADPASDGSPWSDFDGRRADYGLIYFDPAMVEIAPSKRQLAWSQGISDLVLMRSVGRQKVLDCFAKWSQAAAPGRARYSAQSHQLRACLRHTGGH